MRWRGWPPVCAAALLSMALLASSAMAAEGNAVAPKAAPAAADGAATAPPPLRDYAIDAWSSRNGLPHNSLRDMAQTPDGYLWFATWEGVVRYNGVAFTVFDRGSEPGLRDNGVGALYVDPQGRLWLSDSRGNLAWLAGNGRWEFVERTPQWPQALIHDLAMDGRGRLWLLFEGHGLGCLHPDGRFDYLAAPPQVPLRASFPRMAIDAGDRIWIGTLDGLVMRDDAGRWHRFGADAGLPSGLVWPYVAPDGTLWVAAEGQVFRHHGNGFARVHALPGAGHFTSMLQDRHGALWLGTENRGVARIGVHGVEWLAPGPVLPRGRIASLLEDAEGSVWVGANGGLFRLRETLFSSWTRRDGLGGDYVRAVLEDRDGTLWVGGGGGLDRQVPGGGFRPVPLPGAGGETASVLSLAQGADGDLWVGTFADGVYRLRDGVLLRRYGQADGVPSGHVRALAADRGGAVWVGTRRGVVRIDAAGVHPPPPVPDLPDGLVTALAVIGEDLWIGSVAGASVLRGGTRVERLDLDAAGGGARTVFGFQQVDGRTWIATDRGLFRHRDGGLARIGLEQGLPVDAVFQLVPDREGAAWITSNRGVLRVPMAALREHADGTARRPLAVQRYTEIDGLPSAQGNGSSAPAAILRRDGTLWVATAAGIASADPARLRRYLDRPPPPAVIESVQLDGQALDWRSRDSLPGGARVTVAYAGLSYLLPERIGYRTRLHGLDEDWIERGTQRAVEFIGLPPGEYTLEVAAAHPEGGWSAQPARWTFGVRPLWWQRTDVRAAALLAVLLGLFALVQRYRASNRRLARLVDERTDDLRHQASRLEAADREKQELLDRLSAHAELLERHAYQDALTGLPNRRAFEEVATRQLAQASAGGAPLALAILDIDHFKRINDERSHAVGDEVLRDFARVIRQACRPEDFLARTGGEEFVLLLPGVELPRAREVCERVRRAVERSGLERTAQGLAVTVSVGVAERAGAHGLDVLMQAADQALYRAKRLGRNRVQAAGEA
ncbi:diguanylate cyclase (GGDEF)-like protein [Pseudoxanthomonas broegbernensis]|nr:ligand-binding sensor domain-containing diguanylate cyclase [Pseudoxanthomonas broegbernensis]MBB6064032.1 diguanylate cyclase (GGDEF)-like protein [Pseudoxanthomonas broegbernensis]